MQANLTGIRNNLTGLRQRWGKAKPTKTTAFWIALGAIVLTLILGFTRGGWTTGGSATKMAETSASSAVIARLAPICVAQFNADAQRGAKFTELKALTSFKRSAFVEEQGWATMPGESAADKGVIAECTKQLMLIEE
jgi:hypothetical protein